MTNFRQQQVALSVYQSILYGTNFPNYVLVRLTMISKTTFPPHNGTLAGDRHLVTTEPATLSYRYLCITLYLSELYTVSRNTMSVAQGLFFGPNLSGKCPI